MCMTEHLSWMSTEVTGHAHMHRPHSGQVTGARCTEVAARQSWILLEANNGQQALGVADKRFFRFKRNAYHLWTAIIQHRLNDITHQQVMHFNQGSKFANIFKVHLKHPQCFGTLAQPSHFLSNMPVMTQRIFTGPARVEWLWLTSAPMNTIYGTGDPALVDMWRTSQQNMKYQSSLQGWGEYYSGTRLAQNDKHEYTKNIVLEYWFSSTRTCMLSTHPSPASLRRRVITGGSQKAVWVSRRMDCRIGVIKFYVSANN